MEKKVKLSSVSDVYSAKELADELGVSRSMVYYLGKTNKIKSHSIQPIKYVFNRNDIKEYLKKEGYAIDD